MTIESLEAELASIKEKAAQTAALIQQQTANLNALAGAEQILLKLIGQEKESNTQPKEKKPKQSQT